MEPAATVGPSSAPPARRPRTRGECAPPRGVRPCPWSSTCRYGLVGGACALDYAEQGPQTLPVVAAALGVTRARIQQHEKSAMRKLREAASDGRLAALLGEDVVGELAEGGVDDPDHDDPRRRIVRRLLRGGALNHTEIAALAGCSDALVANVAREEGARRS